MATGFSTLALSFLVAATGLLLSPLAFCVTQYTVTDLGTLGGEGSWARGINDVGQVAGGAQTASGEWRAYLWQNGVMRDLGTLGGAQTEAWGINASGQVVGRAETSSGGWNASFLWTDDNGNGQSDPGEMRGLGTLGGTSSHAYGINASGQVVGYSYTATGDVRAFLWSDGVMRDLGTLGGTASYAQGINASGQVVGAAWPASGLYHAFLWENGVMQDLGALGGAQSVAFGINDLGQVVGSAHINDQNRHAFLWDDDIMHDLGTLSDRWTEAYSINNSAQVVGYSCLVGGGEPYHALLWEQDALYELNDLIPSGSGWLLGRAHAINDAGQIVGWGKLGGNTHAFLLTPIPEPSMLSMLCLAFLAGLARLRKK